MQTDPIRATLTDVAWGLLVAASAIDPDGIGRIAIGLQIAVEDSRLTEESRAILAELHERLIAFEKTGAW